MGVVSVAVEANYKVGGEQVKGQRSENQVRFSILDFLTTEWRVLVDFEAKSGGPNWVFLISWAPRPLVLLPLGRGRDVIVCADINECENEELCMYGTCVNQPGGYECLCDDDHQLIPTGTGCVGLYRAHLDKLPSLQYSQYHHYFHCSLQLDLTTVILYVTIFQTLNRFITLLLVLNSNKSFTYLKKSQHWLKINECRPTNFSVPLSLLIYHLCPHQLSPLLDSNPLRVADRLTADDVDMHYDVSNNYCSLVL